MLYLFVVVIIDLILYQVKWLMFHNVQNTNLKIVGKKKKIYIAIH